MITINRRLLLAFAASFAAMPSVAQEAEEAASQAAAEAPDVRPYSIGNPDAPIKIVEYASFTCPHCANFHASVFKPLKAEYIDTGKVHFTLKEVYFDRYGLWGALVARCGGEMKYFGIADMLFSQQSDWATQQSPEEAVKKLRTIGLTAGLTNEQLDTCLADSAKVEALVQAFQENMDKDEVTGTPTLFINGERNSNMSYADLKKILEAKLGG